MFISYVFLLNCLYLNSQILLFVCSAPYPTAGEGPSERLRGPSCPLLG